MKSLAASWNWSAKAKLAPQSKPSSCACCIACGIEGRSEAAHTGSDGGMSMKASDYSWVPLCSGCHTQAPGAYHRVGKRVCAHRGATESRVAGAVRVRIRLASWLQAVINR